MAAKCMYMYICIYIYLPVAWMHRDLISLPGPLIYQTPTYRSNTHTRSLMHSLMHITICIHAYSHTCSRLTILHASGPVARSFQQRHHCSASWSFSHSPRKPCGTPGGPILLFRHPEPFLSYIPDRACAYIHKLRHH